MLKSLRLLRLFCLLVVLAAVCFLILNSRYTHAAAQAVNGRIAFTSDSAIYTINPDGSDLLQLTPFGDGFRDRYPSTPTPSPSPTFTVSGTVTDTNGQPLVDVTLVMLSEVTGTQITFTNASGNYVFHYVGGVSYSLNITPSKTGHVFNPAAVTFISSDPLTGDRTLSFVGTPSIIPAPFQLPILLTQEDSLRAAALDSVTLRAEPFGVININNFSADQRGRVSLFATNIELAQGEPITAITAQAEDSLGSIYPLTVESYGAVPNFPWLKQVVVKLPDNIGNAVEVRVRLKLRGNAGNKVIMRVKP